MDEDIICIGCGAKLQSDDPEKRVICQKAR